MFSVGSQPLRLSTNPHHTEQKEFLLIIVGALEGIEFSVLEPVLCHGFTSLRRSVSLS
jgi:hypothetical protein